MRNFRLRNEVKLIEKEVYEIITGANEIEIIVSIYLDFVQAALNDESIEIPPVSELVESYSKLSRETKLKIVQEFNKSKEISLVFLKNIPADSKNGSKLE